MIEKKIAGEVFSSQKAWEFLESLCDDFGSRFAGTKGEALCVDFLASFWEEIGLEVKKDSFSYLSWSRGVAQLEVVEPIHWQVPCLSLPYTPSGEWEGELCCLFWGTPEEFEEKAEEIQGKFLLVSSETPPHYSRWIHRKEKYARAVLARATAFLYVNGTPGLGPQTGSLMSHQQAPIPGVALSYEVGERLRRLQKRHGALRLRLSTSDVLEKAKSWNVLADLAGRQSSYILVCSHYDGHDISQGAIDPASGMVAVMEAARVLSLLGFEGEHTIRFAAWGAEEIGLIGSSHYVNQYPEEVEKCLFVLNFDSAGGMKVQGVQLHQWPELEPWFQRWFSQIRHDAPVGQKMNAYSDHFPFTLEGIATAEIGDPTPFSGRRGYTHTPLDTLDKVSKAGVLQAAYLAAYLASQLAQLPKEVFPKRSKKEVELLLEKDPFLEPYRLSQKLKGEKKE